MAKVRQRKREMVEGLIALHLDLYKRSGAELILGDGRFVAPKTLEVRLRDGGMRVLTGERIFLNLGTRATIPPTPGLADAEPLTHIEALELNRLPTHLIVLGGGYVGIELAQAYRRFGSRVTVVEHRPQLAGREDPDVVDAIARLFADEGVEVLLSAEVLQVEGRSGESVRPHVPTPQGEQLIEGSDILAATGRTPNTAGIGLEAAGVRLDGGAISRSTTAWRPVHRTSGRSGSAPAAPSLRTCPRTTFAWSATTSPGGAGRCVTGSSPSACLRTRPWRGSASTRPKPGAAA
jgi:pyruvate/2-oxoglutarate dehydrogenase complex dihydrolipoamide dehydrogenase (E3) component